MNKKIFQYAIALTGGIATGKSTVCSLLKQHGFLIIDADKIAHKLLDLNSNFITKMFGDKYVKDGKVLRKELGKIIFSKEENKLKLEEFIHPLIKEEIEKQALIIEKDKRPYFIDIPLFFEKMKYDIDKCLVVYTPKDLQVKRLMKRDNISKDEALLKMSNQMDIEDKKEKADFIIDNSNTVESLNKELKKVIEEIL